MDMKRAPQNRTFGFIDIVCYTSMHRALGFLLRSVLWESTKRIQEQGGGRRKRMGDDQKVGEET